MLPSSAIAPGRELLALTFQTGERIETLKVAGRRFSDQSLRYWQSSTGAEDHSEGSDSKAEIGKHSGMPEKYGEIYTLKQLLDIIAYLKSGEPSASSWVVMEDLF